MKHLALIVVIVTGILLLHASQDFPDWGDPDSPANDNQISQHFITKTGEQTAVPNFVTAVLADYRGFDTLFETVVVFIAGIAIMAVLGLVRLDQLGKPAAAPSEPTDRDIIIIQTCRIITPVIQLFALYVVAHGHHSPGGGFQGGVIFGASLILMAISRDLPAALKRISARRAFILAIVGILIYEGIGLLCMTMGGNFLDYSVLHPLLPATDSIMARSHGMLGVEIGVAFTVSTIMFAIYALLSSGGRLKGGL